MNIRNSLIAAFALVLAVPSVAVAKDKKNGQRGMLESMQSVPCGAKERGLTGLGSMVAAVGVEHVNSHEQLCPQYLLRTDEMDYHIRPLDTKHAAVLPVGHEAEFRIKKDRLFMKMVDGKEKPLQYQVVAMQPKNTAEGKLENTADRPMEKPAEAAPPVTPGREAGSGVSGQAVPGQAVVASPQQPAAPSQQPQQQQPQQPVATQQQQPAMAPQQPQPVATQQQQTQQQQPVAQPAVASPQQPQR
jgi:hypothetical protein